MLSIENSSPADPNENSLEGVDLSNPSLDDHNLVPNFCIRDYVFNNRRKDIATNWPFSQKSLQLCMKHGVKDLLPPIDKDFVELNFVEKGKPQNLDMDPCKPSNVEVNSSPNDDGNMSFSGFESDKQLPLTPNTPPQEVFPKTFEKPEPHFPKKPDIPKPTSMKKYKLIVKVGSTGAEQNSNSSTAAIVKPIAASKVCPVCKTFSSSSNTKLNAHIDQCLSVDSPIEPSSKSRAIKHRIKPRKTRLMVDIYATALHCTLEELDRRNGRVWNEKPTLSPIQEIGVDFAKKKKKNDSFKEKSDDDVVYIDTNGTKLRILNKITDTSLVSKLGVSSSKSLKGGKVSKWLSTYKKNKKHHKYWKLASQREKQCSYKTRLACRNNKVLGDQEKDLPEKENLKTDAIENTNMAPSFKAQKQMKVLDTGTIMPKWASSKRTNLFKRRSEIHHSSLDNLKKGCSEKVRICYEIPNSSPKKGKEMSNSSFQDRVNDCHEQPPMKKKMRFKSFEAQNSTKVTKFSPSKEQMLSGGQSSLSQPKFSKKGPFRVKNVDIRDDREKNLEHQHRINEDSGIAQLPLKRSNLLKMKKKSPSLAIISQRNESTEDEFLNVEKPHGGKSVIEQSSEADCENFMSLAESFDQDSNTVADTNMGMEMCPTNEQMNYFSGVDPIIIPSPPGSFLPSPGRISSDEDMADRDSSNSPKSAISTVFNTLETKSDSKMVENPQNEMIKLGFSDKITKSYLGFQDGQPCCCSRKEGISVNSQESQFLRRRAMENPSRFYPNERANDMISRGNSSVCPVPVPDVGPIYGDYGSPSPCSPNPVLRLMGKNLTVVNNDENSNQSRNSKFQIDPQVSPFYGYKAIDLDLPIDLNRSRNIQFSPLRHNNKIERVEASFPGTIYRNEESIIPKDRKEVIIIDDSPENQIPSSSSGVSSPMASYYNFNPFYSSNQGYDFSHYNRGPHLIPNVSSQMSAPPGLGSMRWNNVIEGSRMPPPSSVSPYRRF